MAELYPAEDLYPSDSLYPGEDPEGEGPVEVPTRIAVGQEFVPDRYAVRVSDPKTGRTIARLSDDESNLENIIERLGHSSEMQGGSKDLKGDLARNPRISANDLPAYADLTAYIDGVEEVWWGRVDKEQGAEGDRTGVELNGVGHIAALEDDKACLGLGFIDSDMTKWGDPSVERRRQLIEAGIQIVANTSLGFGSLEDEKEPPGIIDDFNGVTTVEGKTAAGESHYDSGGVDIERVLYDRRRLSASEPNAAWEGNMALAGTDTFTSPTTGTDHDAETALQQEVAAPDAGYRRARLRDRLTTTTGGNALTRLFAWQHLKVLGRTGLALQGTWPNVGFTAKQMLEYCVPLYSYLEARDEDLEDDGFVIPHAWFADPGPLVEVVKELTKYGLLDWFIYQGKRLQLRYPGSYGRFWQAAPGPAELRETGLDANRLWREIIVAFQTSDGVTRYAGPPGSGAHIEDPSLEITDPDHPAVRADITRRDVLVMKGPGDDPTAVAIGSNWLVDANELSHAGECALTDWVMSDRGIWYPSSVVKAGDHVRLQGRDPSYRKVVSADYQRDERKATCNLDAPPEGLAALEERFGVELRAAGLAA